MSKGYVKISILGMLLHFSGDFYVHGKTLIPISNTYGNVFHFQKHPLKIVDEFGKPLVGAQIIGSTKDIIGQSDGEGKVILSGLTGQELVTVLAKGYYPKEINIGQQQLVAMVPRYVQQQDTVQVLYDRKAKANVLGSVATVYNSALNSTPSSLYLNALIGRLPGFYTQEVGGFRSARTAAITAQDLAGSLPSDDTKYNTSLTDNSELIFQLRGQNPVTLIDGVQREIYAIDPESIESITVAKDALSTLFLGQRSSRGILQITTKRGAVGAPRISFSAETGIQQNLKMQKPLEAHQYAYLYNEALLNAGRQPVYTQVDFDAYKNGDSPVLFPNVNWYDATIRNNNPISRFNLGVNGGVKNARYYLNLSYLSQQGMFKSSDEFSYATNLQQSRYLINSAIDLDVTKDFTIGLQLFGRIQDGRQPGAGVKNIMNTLYSTPNNAYPIFNPDGSYGGSSVFRTNLYQMTTGSGYLLDNTRDLLANLDFNYKLDQWLPGLYVKGKLNVSSGSSSLTDRNRKQPVYNVRYNDQGELVYVRYGTIEDQPNSFATTSSANFFYYQGTVGYDRSFDNGHSFGFKVFMDKQTSNYQFDLPAIYSNYAGSFDYNFKQRYFLEVALNYSGFNRFQPGERHGLFYATGLGWDLAKEDFMHTTSPWLNQLKLRATNGRTGNINENALGYYSWRAAYGQRGVEGYDFGSEYAYVNSIIEKGLANIGATWEKADKLNIGLDVGLWNDKFRLTAEYFRDKYFDLLQQRGSTIELIGIAYPNENIGKNLYEGQELTVTYQNKINSFNYFVTANASRMRTEVLYMNEVFQKYDWNRRTGKPVGQAFGYIADGLIQTQEEADNAPLLNGNKVHPGDVKLRDLNGDGIINSYDQAPIGTTKPTIYYGATFGFNWKGIDFAMLWQGVANRSYQQVDYSFGSNGEGQGFAYMLDRWTPETAQTAKYPRLTVGADPTNTPMYTGSSFWIKNGAYLRLRNVDLGYTFPQLLTQRIKLSSLRVFVNAQNLLTLTPYSRLDPEVYSPTAYPAQRIISFGVNIKL